MFFSIITKNLNWEIWNMNLVTFKICDKVKDRKFKYGGSLKNLVFRGQVPEKPIYRVELPQKGAWTVSRFKGKLDKNNGGGAFEGGWYPNAHYGYWIDPILGKVYPINLKLFFYL